MLDCITKDINFRKLAYAEPNKGTTIYTDLGLQKQCWILL